MYGEQAVCVRRSQQYVVGCVMLTSCLCVAGAIAIGIVVVISTWCTDRVGWWTMARLRSDMGLRPCVGLLATESVVLAVAVASRLYVYCESVVFIMDCFLGGFMRM